VASSATAQSSNDTSEAEPFEKTASFELDNSTRAQMDLPTVAYDSAAGTTNYTIGVEMKTDGGKTRLALRFPYHISMFYDPVTSFVDVAEPLASSDTVVAISAPAPAGSTGSGSSGSNSTGGTTAAKNGAAGAVGVRGVLLAGLGAAALFMLGF
jgi:hypothetical protein